VEVLGIVILSLFSKVASLLALFLPIKIILLLGYEKIPKYFPDFLISIERDVLIISLSGLAIFFYVLYVVLEFLIVRLESRGTNKLLQNMRKGVKANKNKALPEKVFKRVSRSITGLVFALSIVIFLACIYVPLLALVLTYAVCVLTVFGLLSKNSNNTTDQDEDDDEQEQENNTIKIWFDAGFLLAFVFIVWQLMNDAPISIITAFISFLLLRKSSGDLKRLAGDLGFLSRQQPAISKIIFEYN
jgi:hypothetical protein